MAVWLIGSAGASASQVDLESWSTYRTPHFTILSNAADERAAEIAATLEQFRAAFSQWSPELELVSPVPTRILAFSDADSYAPFKSGRDSKRAQILGQFLGHRDGNFITLNADPQYLGGFGVVLHEYVHYLVQHNFPAVPRWFNEGLAEYYSTFLVDGEAAVIGGGVERHVHWIRTHDDLRLADLIATTGRTDPVHPSDEVGQFYAVSWGLVHYLLSTEGDRGEQLADFLDRAALGEPPVAAFEEAFDLRIEDLEDDLEAYFLGATLPAARVPLERLARTSASRSSAPRPPTWRASSLIWWCDRARKRVPRASTTSPWPMTRGTPRHTPGWPTCAISRAGWRRPSCFTRTRSSWARPTPAPICSTAGICSP